MIADFVREAIAFAGITQAELARRLTQEIGASIDRAALNKMVAGKRDVSASEMLAIARITGFPIPDELATERSVSVVGFASAGSDQILFEDAQGPFDEIVAPIWATDETVAVSIRGTSLGALLNGWLAFYDDRRNPPDESTFGQLCICGLEDGRVVIKKLRPGSANGLFHLESLIEGTMYDVPVKWAARVRGMEPPDTGRLRKPVRPVVKARLKR